MLPTHRPPTHPGEMLLREFLEPLGVSQVEAARRMNIPFQRLNAIKVPLTGVMNLVSGIAFAIFAPVHWGYALVLAPSTLVGGRIGAAAGRRVPDQPLRLAVVVLGVIAAVWLEFSR